MRTVLRRRVAEIALAASLTAGYCFAWFVPPAWTVELTDAERRAGGDQVDFNAAFPSHSPAGGYLATAETRLVRGAVNVSTFPVDAVACPARAIVVFTHEPVIMGLLNIPFSVAEGLAHSAYRGFSGLFDVTTFWVPGIEGFAPPPTYGCEELIWGPHESSGDP